MDGRRYYRPVPRGLETKIAEKLERLRALDGPHGETPDDRPGERKR